MKPSAFPARVVLSSGGDRIHFVETACALLNDGVDVHLIVGWIPSPRQQGLANWLGRWFGKPDLYRRLMVRRADGALDGRLRSLPIAEGVLHLLTHLGRTGLIPLDWAQSAGWRWFGRRSRRHVRDADLFHVRSGAGQGGAIADARRRGARVLVDHSIAHPTWMERVVAPAYRERGRIPAFTFSRFWQLVLEDCAEADGLLVNSDFVRETFIDAGYRADRIHVAYLGVREDFIGLKSHYRSTTPFRLIFTGSFSLRKGVHVLIDALEWIQEAGIDCELTVAGSRDDADLVLANRHLSRPPRFLGALPQADLKRLLAESDAFVFPTLAEGCAKSAMEAMAVGLPVVTTRACGLPARDGIEVLIAPIGDSMELARAVVRLAKDEDLRRNLGQNACSRVRGEFRWCHYSASVQQAYRNLLSSP